MISPVAPDAGPAAGGAEAVLTYFRSAGAIWEGFGKLPLSGPLQASFMDLHLQGAAGRLDSWAETAGGALALVLLLDQVPRHAFFGTSRMYATDGLARSHADKAIGAGLDRQVPPDLCAFFYLP